MERCAGGDAGLVGHTKQAEVVVFVEVVAGDRFAETQLEMIAHRQDAVHRFGIAEEHRHAGVLDAADDGRCLVYIARAVTAERYGTQVIFLLHRVALAIEAEGHDTSVLYHRFVTRCLLIEAILRKERA